MAVEGLCYLVSKPIAALYNASLQQSPSRLSGNLRRWYQQQKCG